MQENDETIEDLRLRGPKGPLSQVQVAVAAGLSQKQVSQIELGHIARPHPETVIGLATALGVDPQRAAAAVGRSYSRGKGSKSQGGQAVSHAQPSTEGGAL